MEIPKKNTMCAPDDFNVAKKKCKKIEKKNFFPKGKTQKHKGFISDNINRGSLVYLSGHLGIWDIWDMTEKNTQSLGPKIVFCLLNPITPSV